MNETKTIHTSKKLTVTLPELQAMLNCGRCSATKIADAAGAKIKIGRRTLYHVGKVEKYLDSITDQGA